MEKPFWNATLTVYVNDDLEGRRLQFLLQQKGVPARMKLTGGDWPEELARVNSCKRLPCITDKNLLLFGNHIIDEYIHERYPAPQLLPYEPKDRAIARFLCAELRALYRVPEMDARDTLWEALWSASPWYMGNDFTIVDVTAAPLLERAAANYIDTPDCPIHVRRYWDRLQKKLSFATFKEQLRSYA